MRRQRRSGWSGTKSRRPKRSSHLLLLWAKSSGQPPPPPNRSRRVSRLLLGQGPPPRRNQLSRKSTSSLANSSVKLVYCSFESLITQVCPYDEYMYCTVHIHCERNIILYTRIKEIFTFCSIQRGQVSGGERSVLRSRGYQTRNSGTYRSICTTVFELRSSYISDCLKVKICWF